VHSTINITAVNDNPVLSGTSTIGYSENSAATPINTNIVLSDVDTGILSNATVSISNYVSGQDVLSFTPNANTGNIVASFNATTGVLTLSSPNNSGTPAQFQAALRAVFYANTSDNPSTVARDITFVANDGSAVNNLSSVVHSTINIFSANNNPTLNGTSTITYSENSAATPINTSIVLSDVDSATLSNAKVSISNYVFGEDFLSFTSNSNTGNILASFNATTGVLILSSPNNSGTLAQFQAALRAVSYANTSENPSIVARDITFVVDDGGAANNISSVVHSTINITAINDNPVLSGTNIVYYTENAAAVPINTNISLSDIDSATLSNSKVTINNYIPGEDVLSFNPNLGTGNIIANFNVATGVLTLTSPDNSGTLAQFQAALRAVSYANTSDNPSTVARDVTFTADDGANINNLSDIAHSTINITEVNDAPTLNTISLGGTFNQNGVVVLLFTNTTISTIENNQAIKSLTFTISNVLDDASEKINIDGSSIPLINTASGFTAGNSLSYSVVVSNRVATVYLTKESGVSTAYLSNVINGLSYQNISANPTAGARTIALTQLVDTGGNANSGVNKTNITVASAVTSVTVVPAPKIELPLPMVAQTAPVAEQAFFKSTESVKATTSVYSDSPYVDSARSSMSTGSTANSVTTLLAKFSRIPSWGESSSSTIANLTPIVSSLSSTISALQVNAQQGESPLAALNTGKITSSTSSSLEEDISSTETDQSKTADSDKQNADIIADREKSDKTAINKKEIQLANLETTKNADARGVNFQQRVKNVLKDFGFLSDDDQV
ncbi:MAG: hypothetical protein ABI597_13380, partial [Gammaproteobacteria bacterium]